MSGEATPTAEAAPGTAPELLVRAASASPHTPALSTGEASISYGELLERAGAGARELREAGVGAGAAVAVRLPNGIEWLVAYWGAALNGNVVVPLSPRAPAEELERQLAHTRAAALRSEVGLRLLEQSRGEIVSGAGAAREPAEAVHVVQLTSGSTGEPKGAMLTHRGLVSAARHQAEAWGLAAGEAVFVPNPFCHILGLVYGVLMPAVARATTLTQPRFDPDAALDLLATGRAVAMAGAPSHLQMLAERVERRGLELPDLRLALTGGAAMAPAWVDRVRKALDLEALINGYGMSEVGSVAHTRLDDSPEQVASSVGFLVPGLEARIVDPASGPENGPEPGPSSDGEESGRDLPDGEVGELWLRGPSVMRGYLDDEAATRRALVGADRRDGGWLRTRDLFRRDATGRLSFVGRLDDMLTVGGFNVYPAEVERVLSTHPEIAQAAVVGRAHDRLGRVPVAFVSGRRPGSRGPDPSAVVEHCRARLRGYMVPRRVAVLEELPVNRSGKVDKRRLTKLAEDLDVE